MGTRGFKGVWIPARVWLNKDLTIMEKLFLVEIDSLDNSQGCFASNAHFSEFFDISKGRCTQIIKQLEAKKLIKIKLIRDKKLITKRVIKVVNKLNTPSEKTKQGYLENDEGSNTSINNTKDNIYSDIIDLYNSLCTDLPKAQIASKKRLSTIKARCNDHKDYNNLEFWSNYFNHINKSPFLTGKTSDFRASLDWVTNKSNFIKILEGNYNHEKQQRTNQPNNKQQVEQYFSDPNNLRDF